MLTAEPNTTDLCGASPEARVEFNRAHVGPTKALFDRLDPAAEQALSAELAGCFQRFNRATDGTLVASADYLQVTAVHALSLPRSRAEVRRNHGCPSLCMLRCPHETHRDANFRGLSGGAPGRLG
jgi:hypothetical protein